VTDTTTSLINRFAQVQIHSSPTPPPAILPEPELNNLDDLLQACSSKSVQPFQSFQTSSIFISNVWPKVRKPNPVIRKIGEASYSEVFGLKVGNQEVVVKVIPLLSGENVSVQGGDRPDCSECGDVKRELEVTKRMAGIPNGGFVDFLRSALWPVGPLQVQ
jgi:serine/threonine-protein kinase haspin